LDFSQKAQNIAGGFNHGLCLILEASKKKIICGNLWQTKNQFNPYNLWPKNKTPELNSRVC
jgi:hypothetical protein